MLALFESLTNAVEGNPFIAVSAAFIWGILSVLLSPCHLASIPLIIGYIDEQGKISPKRAFFISLLFAAGILVSIAIIGGITAAAGRMLGDLGSWANYLVSFIFFMIGLHLLGVITIPFKGAEPIKARQRGLLAAVILGLVFGIALGPCTFAYMAPMLGVTFRVASTNLLYGIVLLIAFGIGHCAVIVAAGTSTELVQRYLNWNENSKGTIVLKKICGVLVIMGGLYLIYTA